MSEELVLTISKSLQFQPDVLNINLSLKIKDKEYQSLLAKQDIMIQNIDKLFKNKKEFAIVLKNNFINKSIDENKISILVSTLSYQIKSKLNYENYQNILKLLEKIDCEKDLFTSFALNDSEKASQKVLEECFKEAEKKAQYIASLANKKIIGIKNISYAGQNHPQLLSARALNKNIEPEMIDIYENITITYLLK